MIVGDLDPNKSELSTLVSFLFADLFRLFRIKKIRKILQRSTGLSKKQIRILIGLMKKKAFIHRRLILWNKIHQLFHYWHVFHRTLRICNVFYHGGACGTNRVLWVHLDILRLLFLCKLF